MSNAKRVTVVSVQREGNDAIVRLSAEGGWGAELLLGPAQGRMMALALAAFFRDVPPSELAREIMDQCEIERPMC